MKQAADYARETDPDQNRFFRRRWHEPPPPRRRAVVHRASARSDPALDDLSDALWRAWRAGRPA